MVHRERRIREIAYILWEQEGYPHGQDDRHWHAAVVQYEAEIAAAEATPGKRAEAKAKGAVAEAAKSAAKPKAAVAEAAKSTAKPKAAKAKDDSPKTSKGKSGKEKPDATLLVAESAAATEPAIKSKGGKRK